jgi:hypothetical protein
MHTMVCNDPAKIEYRFAAESFAAVPKLQKFQLLDLNFLHESVKMAVLPPELF